jgi:hypothetical protein
LSAIPQSNYKLALNLCWLDIPGTLKFLHYYIKLVLPHLQAVSQVALGHRATMLCKCPKNTILVISWQGSFPVVLKVMGIFP